MLIFDQLKKNDPQLRAITWGVLIGLGLLLAGLWWVQVISYRHYAENQRAQSFRTVRIPAIRGKILDHNGAPLAENQPSYNVSLYLEELREGFKEEWKRVRPKGKLPRGERIGLEAGARYRVVSNVVQNLAAALQQPLDLDYGQFLEHYTNQLALPMPVITNLTPVQMARFHERSSGAPGLDLELQPNRFYPHGTCAAHLLGFLTHDNSSAQDEEAFFNFRLPDYRGKVGIEVVFDLELRGKAGMKSVLVNSLGYRQSENIWTPSEPGKNVVLTIDLAIQQAAENALRTHGPDTRGAVVVLNPHNGDVLALASAPTFDPNVYIPRLTHDAAQRLNDPVLRPQINRATQENYAPGSIFKIVDSLACLEAGLDPAEKIQNPGHILVGRKLIKDLAAPGEYDFRRAFLKSSNTYFITNGLRYGVENIVRIGERLHLGERCDLPTRQEVSGSFPRQRTLRQGWSSGDTANLCIGQGPLDVTPVQIAVMTAAIANGGKVLWPRLVDRIEAQEPLGADSTIVFPHRPVRDELGVRPRTLELIRSAMLADVEDAEGTGKAAAVPGLRVCGKTGTAQVANERNQVIDHTVWFASFAPYENPRYVVVGMVESGASGGGTCAPIAQKIYRALLDRENYNAAKPPPLARTE